MPSKSKPQIDSPDDTEAGTPPSLAEQPAPVDDSPPSAMGPALWMGLFLAAVILWQIFMGK